MTAASARLTSPAPEHVQGRVPALSVARPCRLCALWQVCSEPMPLATSRPRGHRAAAAQGSLCAWERLTRCMQGLSPARARRARRMAPLCAQHPRGARPLRRWRCARARRAPTQAPPHGVRRSAPAQRALPRPPAAHPAARPPVPALRCSRARPCPPQCARPRRRAPDPPAQRAAAHPCPSLGHPCPGAGTCRYCIPAEQNYAVYMPWNDACPQLSQYKAKSIVSMAVYSFVGSLRHAPPRQETMPGPPAGALCCSRSAHWRSACREGAHDLS